MALNRPKFNNTTGVAVDLSHINTDSKVAGFGKEELDAALKVGALGGATSQCGLAGRLTSGGGGCTTQPAHVFPADRVFPSPPQKKGCDVVIIPAGVPRKPGMTRDDLFNINAGAAGGGGVEGGGSAPSGATGGVRGCEAPPPLQQ